MSAKTDAATESASGNAPTVTLHDGNCSVAAPPRWSSLTRAERQAISGAIARREAVEQGLPEVCDDPATYAKLGRIWGWAS